MSETDTKLNEFKEQTQKSFHDVSENMKKIRDYILSLNSILEDKMKQMIEELCENVNKSYIPKEEIDK